MLANATLDNSSRVNLGSSSSRTRAWRRSEDIRRPSGGGATRCGAERAFECRLRELGWETSGDVIVLSYNCDFVLRPYQTLPLDAPTARLSLSTPTTSFNARAILLLLFASSSLSLSFCFELRLLEAIEIRVRAFERRLCSFLFSSWYLSWVIIAKLHEKQLLCSSDIEASVV